MGNGYFKNTSNTQITELLAMKLPQKITSTHYYYYNNNNKHKRSKQDTKRRNRKVKDFTKLELQLDLQPQNVQKIIVRAKWESVDALIKGKW